MGEGGGKAKGEGVGNYLHWWHLDGIGSGRGQVDCPGGVIR